jgi:RNA-binding protein
MSIHHIKGIKMDIKQLRSKAKSLEPILWIGKNGITDSVIQEIRKLLRKKRIIKIKLLKSALKDTGKKEAIHELVNKTDAILIEAVGFVCVLAKKQKDI